MEKESFEPVSTMAFNAGFVVDLVLIVPLAPLLLILICQLLSVVVALPV